MARTLKLTEQVMEITEDWHDVGLPWGSPIRVPIMRPLTLLAAYADPVIPFPGVSSVLIYFERFRRPNGSLMVVAFTGDAETALLLNSVFLPGQQRAVRERDAFSAGFADAIAKVLGL
jgi:hypothetical protein